MISKVPVPIALLKQTLGIRDTDDVIKISVTGNEIHLYVATDGNSASEFSDESEDTPMEFSVSLGGNEAS